MYLKSPLMFPLRARWVIVRLRLLPLSPMAMAVLIRPVTLSCRLEKLVTTILVVLSWWYTVVITTLTVLVLTTSIALFRWTLVWCMVRAVIDSGLTSVLALQSRQLGSLQIHGLPIMIQLVTVLLLPWQAKSTRL